jgi:hypothetical protein
MQRLFLAARALSVHAFSFELDSLGFLVEKPPEAVGKR